MPEVSEGLIEVGDGARLWTATSVVPGAPAVVLLHGGPGLWDYLGPVADLVAGAVTTCRYDQRGCGRSSADGEQTMAQHVQDLEELRRHLGHERWFVFGHSWGATLGLSYAAAHPTAVAGLIHADGMGLDWPRHSGEHKRRAGRRRTTEQNARLDELTRRDRTEPEELEWRTLSWLPDFVAGPWVHARALAESPWPINQTANRALMTELRARPSTEAQAEAAALDVPVLLVHGAEDPRPIDGVRALAEVLPDRELVVLPGAGHSPWVERPADVRDLVTAFVAAHA